MSDFMPRPAHNILAIAREADRMPWRAVHEVLEAVDGGEKAGQG